MILLHFTMKKLLRFFYQFNANIFQFWRQLPFIRSWRDRSTYYTLISNIAQIQTIPVKTVSAKYDSTLQNLLRNTKAENCLLNYADTSALSSAEVKNLILAGFFSLLEALSGFQSVNKLLGFIRSLKFDCC